MKELEAECPYCGNRKNNRIMNTMKKDEPARIDLECSVCTNPFYIDKNGEIHKGDHKEIF